jgi:hypothetical protein
VLLKLKLTVVSFAVLAFFVHNISLHCSLNVGKYTYDITLMCGPIFTKLGTDVMSLEDVRTT